MISDVLQLLKGETHLKLKHRVTGWGLSCGDSLWQGY